MHHVALILGPVHGARQPEPACVQRYPPDVMAGGNGVEPQLLRPMQQPVELHMTVALHTRIGGEPLGMGRHIRVHHMRVEVGAEIEHVMTYAQLLRHPPSIIHVGHRTAARITLAAPQLERGPLHPVPLIDEHGGRH